MCSGFKIVMPFSKFVVPREEVESGLVRLLNSGWIVNLEERLRNVSGIAGSKQDPCIKIYIFINALAQASPLGRTFSFSLQHY